MNPYPHFKSEIPVTGKATSLAANIKMPTIKQEEKTHRRRRGGGGGGGQKSLVGRGNGEKCGEKAAGGRANTSAHLLQPSQLLALQRQGTCSIPWGCFFYKQPSKVTTLQGHSELR